MSVSLEDWKQHRNKHGYPDFGPTRLPVIPMVLVLVDRDDGTLWSLSWNSVDFSPPDSDGRASVTDVQIDKFFGQRLPQAFDGVYLENNYVLFIRSGRLGLDDKFVGQTNLEIGPPQFARQSGVFTYRQLILINPQNSPALPLRLAILSIGDPING